MPAVEFGIKTAADAYREEYPEHICSDDDARLKTVTFTSDAPEWLLEQARLEGDESRGDTSPSPGQAPLTDSERAAIDFTETTVPTARTAKAIYQDEGVNSWDPGGAPARRVGVRGDR